MASKAKQGDERMAPDRVAQDLIARAKTGDAEAFRRLTEPLRRELEVHCYRLLGSLQDAEDTLQEALLAAWQGFAEFEGRASLRTWLYRIATNRCLNARRAIERRPAQAWNVPGVTQPQPTRLGAWLTALLLAWAASAAILLLSPFLERLLKRRGLLALERVMGMLLVMLAVQLFLDGLAQHAAAH